MIPKSSPSLYHLNLIRDLREKERKVERQKRLSVILGLGCFGFFLLSLIYSGLTIWQMERVLTNEGKKLAYLKQEYNKYTAARLIVDKSDVELLDGLQSKGIFWTRKLAALAKHLPESYAITSFKFSRGQIDVTGNGSAGPKQDQLLILDDYLGKLRSDTAFSDVFPLVFLNSADRRDNGRVAFMFTCVTRGGNTQ